MVSGAWRPYEIINNNNNIKCAQQSKVNVEPKKIFYLVHAKDASLLQANHKMFCWTKKCRTSDTRYTNRHEYTIVVEFYLYPTVGTVLIHSIKPELTE